MSRHRLTDSHGRAIPLGAEIGRGGEGSVFEIRGDSNRVAKLYHETSSPEKQNKLRAMARSHNQRLLEIAAWPIETLHESAAGPVRGLIMPRVSGHREIHYLYGPAHRKQTFPQADWAFLVHTARNVAAALATVHEAGHVVGDVNQGNVVVSPQATVRLIDCDSFQIGNGNSVYFCEVGVAHFTPPELQGRNFAGVRRTPNHDAFGLAILLFHLLFMGRHPFAGRFLGAGHMPIEKAIAEHRFAFGSASRSVHMERPPNTLPLTDAGVQVALLFERAFHPDAGRIGRPSARDWVHALETLKQELRPCADNAAHKYHRSLPYCPWCRIEKGGGPDFFMSVGAILQQARGFDLDRIWREIERVEPPLADSPLPKPNLRTQPSQRRRIVRYRATQAALVGAWLAGAIALFGGGAPLWIAATVLGVLRLVLAHQGGFWEEMQRQKKVVEAAGRDVHRLEAKWRESEKEAARRFQEAREQLTRDRVAHEGLRTEEQRERLALDRRREELQRNHYLEKIYIERARIPGIGAGRLAILASYGIETASDVTQRQIMSIPGFGPTLTKRVVTWRHQMERGFRFDPTLPVDPADIQQLQQRMVRKRQDLERRLLAGPQELARIVRLARQEREQIQIELQEAQDRLAAARAALPI